MDRTEAQVAGLCNLSPEKAAKFQCRSSGAKFALKCPLGTPSSGGAKFSPLTAALRCLADWLTGIAVGSSPLARPHLVAKAKRNVWLVLTARWEYVGDGRHAKMFRQWVSLITLERLLDRVYLNWMRVAVAQAADKAARHDANAAQAAWSSWINDGPAKSLGRHHRMTKIQTGWIPSKFGKAERDDEEDVDAAGDAGVDDLVDERTLVQAAVLPLSSQAEVDAEAVKWGAEWSADVLPAVLPWPDLSAQAPLPAISVDIACSAACTFPPGTGLGWDKLHPRAISRCHDEAILALIRILVLAELLGQWPGTIGIILICLIPKPDGGRRPIGLLPSVVR